MNRHEFYDKLNEYKSLQHASDYKYYNKIDLGNGKTRYFYTKAEWDAYQEGEARNKYEQQKKTIANNKAASEHEGDRYKKPTKLTQSDTKQHSYSAEQAEKEIKNRELFEARKRGKERLIKSTSDIAKNIYDNFDIEKYYKEGDDPQTVLNRIKEDGIFDEIQKNMKILYDNGYITFDNTTGGKGWHVKDGGITNGLNIYEKIEDAGWKYKDLGTVFSRLLSKNFEDSLYPPNYDPNKIYLTGNTVFPDEIKEYAKKELGVDLSGDKQKILTKEQYEKINDYRKKIYS